MFNVSEAWNEANQRFLAPEGFVEISCYIPETNETLVYTKKDLLSFKHEQSGDILSASLPKNYIEFSLDNSDGKWNPNSPRGLERYLSERLKITVRYGYDLDGITEWIPGGVFYLSEWSTSSGGLEARFVARDILEYMIEKPFTGAITGTLYELAMNAIAEASLPDDTTEFVSEELSKYPVSAIAYDGKSSIAEILQKCANAAGCVLYQDRAGVLRIEKLEYNDTGYTVPLHFAYTYPQINLLKPMKEVSVSWGESNKAVYSCQDNGETQTLENNFVAEEAQALGLGEWIADCIRGRRTIMGEFRGDPRLDLFDVVKVENKYGTVAGVVITDIVYRFGGAFHASFSGQVRGVGSNVIYCGEVFTGEVS